MILTAITGSIGCGKTTISNILREQGFLVYDVDKWVKYLYFNERFLKKVKKLFPEIFEGDVFNKKKLREIVFSNPEKLKDLENIIHPILKYKLRKIIRKNKCSDIVFVDVALLFELKWDKFFDYIILADVDYNTQKQRVMIRDNISADDFDKINRLQIPQSVKSDKVDFIVNTGVNKKRILAQMLNIIARLQ